MTLGVAGVLTQREREVLALCARGMTNSEIGEVMEISPSTVKQHVRTIRFKLGVPNKRLLAAQGRQMLGL